MGKYSGLKGKLPAFEPDKKWQDKINDVKKQIIGEVDDVTFANPNWLARRYVNLRLEKQELSEQLSELNTQIEALVQMLTERFDTDGTSTLKLSDGVSLSLKDEPYPVVKDSYALRGWIESTGQTAMLTLPTQTLKGFVKMALEQGSELPPGVEVFLKTGLSCRGLKGADGE